MILSFIDGNYILHLFDQVMSLIIFIYLLIILMSFICVSNLMNYLLILISFVIDSMHHILLDLCFISLQYCLTLVINDPIISQIIIR